MKRGINWIKDNPSEFALILLTLITIWSFFLFFNLIVVANVFKFLFNHSICNMFNLSKINLWNASTITMFCLILPLFIKFNIFANKDERKKSSKYICYFIGLETIAFLMTYTILPITFYNIWNEIIPKVTNISINHINMFEALLVVIILRLFILLPLRGFKYSSCNAVSSFLVDLFDDLLKPQWIYNISPDKELTSRYKYDYLKYYCMKNNYWIQCYDINNRYIAIIGEKEKTPPKIEAVHFPDDKDWYFVTDIPKYKQNFVKFFVYKY